LAEVLRERVLVEVQEQLVVAKGRHRDAHLGEVVQILKTVEEGNRGKRGTVGEEGDRGREIEEGRWERGGK
jgi:hypothetical protein